MTATRALPAVRGTPCLSINIFAAAALLAAAIAFSPPAFAQPASKHEFRGVWIATVINLDWPGSRGVSINNQQKTQHAEGALRVKLLAPPGSAEASVVKEW